MHPVITRTFGGLTRAYYIRQLLFGLCFAVLPIFMIRQMLTSGSAKDVVLYVVLYVVLAVNTLVYPYARFAYEQTVNYIMGENVFIVPVPAMLFAKLFTMMTCWTLAIFGAPIGLIYLYFMTGKAQREVGVEAS